MKTTTTRKFTKIMAAVLAAAAITISAGTTSVSADSTQTSYDSQFLNDMGLCADRWGDTYTYFHWGEVSKAVDECWAKAGVVSVTSWNHGNKYYIAGREVTREEAYDYAAKKLGRPYDSTKYFRNKQNTSDQPSHQPDHRHLF